jgi:hypothetical protein
VHLAEFEFGIKGEVAVVDRRVEYFFLDLGMYLELVADLGNRCQPSRP